jgi:hypothetical protein
MSTSRSIASDGQVLRHFENAGHERGAQIRQLNRATFLPAHTPRAERALPIQGRSEVHGAKSNERHFCGRRRDGEPAVSHRARRALERRENAAHERGAQIRQLNRAVQQGRSGERTGGVPSGYVEDSFDVRTKLGALFSCRSKYRMLKTVVRP